MKNFYIVTETGNIVNVRNFMGTDGHHYFAKGSDIFRAGHERPFRDFHSLESILDTL